MGGDSNSDGKRSSLDFFVPPGAEKTDTGGEDAQSYLERRLQKHRDYLKTAKTAQRTIDDLNRTQENLDQARKLKATSKNRPFVGG